MQLYELGYYQMPMYMQEMILAGLKRKENETVWVQDRTPNPLPNAKTAVADDKRYSTLSRGLYEEVKVKKEYEQYGKFVLDTEKKQLTKFESESNFQFLIDPVVFAWSVDPLVDKYPGWSPYVAMGNNPILYIDVDGRDKITYYKVITDQGTTVHKVVTKNVVMFGVANSVSSAGHKEANFTFFDVEQNITVDLRTGAEEILKIDPEYKTVDIGMIEGFSQLIKEKEVVSKGLTTGGKQVAKEGSRQFLTRILQISKNTASSIVGIAGLILEPTNAGVADEKKHSHNTLDYPIEKKMEIKQGTLYNIEQDLDMEHGTLRKLLSTDKSENQ